MRLDRDRIVTMSELRGLRARDLKCFGSGILTLCVTLRVLLRQFFSRSTSALDCGKPPPLTPPHKGEGNSGRSHRLSPGRRAENRATRPFEIYSSTVSAAALSSAP